jgi:6-phosphogluconolactonase/glucosamine-6-phosphate isomerase/deaminase
MLDDITIPDKNIFGVPVQVKPAKKCALKYSVLIKDFFKEHKQHGFDLIIAGVGPDGHTASLFPGDDKALNEKNRMVIAVKAPKWAEACSRITMTLPLINDCKDMLFVISGEGKDEAMKKILSGDRNYPTARVRAKKDIVWLIDRSSVKLKI